jgi:hypothetical protein
MLADQLNRRKQKEWRAPHPLRLTNFRLNSMNPNLAEVGKPTRWPPGQSGNPAGKPPGTRTAAGAAASCRPYCATEIICLKSGYDIQQL